MFSIDWINGLVILFYMKIPIQDLFVYIGATIGFVKNYYANMKIIEQQLAQQNLKKEEMAAARIQARRDFIHQNSKAFFLKVEKIAEKTTLKGDDKLVLYLKSFIDGMQTTFGEGPNHDEQHTMKEKAVQYDLEDKLAKGMPLNPAQKRELSADITVPIDSSAIDDGGNSCQL
jgi:hypothetical protein